MAKPKTAKNKSAKEPTLDKKKVSEDRSTSGRKAQQTNLKFKNRERIAIATVLGLVTLVYLNSLAGEFVYDDSFQILRNPTLTSAANIPAMFTQGVWQFMNAASREAVGLYYRPLFNSLLIVNYQLFGFSTFGWHLASLVLHLCSTWLVYLLAREWKLKTELSLLAALLFGLHPVHVESVAWISGVPDPLACAFVLLALLIHYRFNRVARPSAMWLSLSAIAGLAAMLAKEVAIVLPVLILAMELIDRSDSESFVQSVVRAAKRSIPALAAVLLYLIARYAVLGFIAKSEIKAAGVTGAEVLLTLPSVLLTYLRLLIAPYPLAIIYDHPFVDSVASVRFIGPAVVLLLITVGAVMIGRRSSLAARALLMLILFILPVLNLKAFNPNESIVHDRYLYLPSIGFCLLLALGVGWLSDRISTAESSSVFSFAPRPLWLGAGVFCLALGILTVYQNHSWSNDVVMAEHSLSVTPNKPFLQNYLGAYYSEHGKPDEAERYLHRAVEMDSAYYDAWSNLGDVYFKEQNWAEAEKAYRKAAEAGAVYAQTYYNLGDVLAKQRKFAEAELPLQKAIEIQPTNAQAFFYLGWVYQQQGQLQKAEQPYRDALRTKPDYLEARINLGAVYSDEGRLKEALEQLENARRAAPGHPVMLYTLGEAYRRGERFQDAIGVFNQLIGGQPQHPLAYTALGLCYEKTGDVEKARGSFQKAIEVAPQDSFTNVSREHLAKLGH